jgi:hypothetical protein
MQCWVVPTSNVTILPLHSEANNRRLVYLLHIKTISIAWLMDNNNPIIFSYSSNNRIIRASPHLQQCIKSCIRRDPKVEGTRHKESDCQYVNPQKMVSVWQWWHTVSWLATQWQLREVTLWIQSHQIRERNWHRNFQIFRERKI